MERATGFDTERSEVLASEFSRRLKSETKPRHFGFGRSTFGRAVLHLAASLTLPRAPT